MFYGMNGDVTQTDGRGLQETIMSKAAAARRGRVDGSDLDTTRWLKIANENKQAGHYRTAFPPSLIDEKHTSSGLSLSLSLSLILSTPSPPFPPLWGIF